MPVELVLAPTIACANRQTDIMLNQIAQDLPDCSQAAWRRDWRFRRESPDEPMTLEDLAAEFGVSPS